MLEQTRALAEKQVRRVRRRLLFRVGVESVMLCWAVGFLAIMFWFLLRPFVLHGLDDAVKWGVPAGLFGASTLAGLLLAWLRRPNLVASSMALDEKFGLKERVTTLLTLSADQVNTPVGNALVRDVTEHLTKLRVASEFPLRISWRRLAVPAGALALALLAALIDPMLGDMRLLPRALAELPKAPKIEVKEIQQQLDNLKKVVAERNQEEQLKSEALKELEKEFEKLLNQPIEKNEEKIRERVNEMRKLEDKMKDRMEGLKEKAEKIDALKKQLEQLGREKDDAMKDGHAKDFEDALMKGNLEKAKAALEQLVKDLKNGKLNEAQQKELAEQFKKVQDKLQKLMENDDFMKKLKQDLKEGKIKKEDMEREMDRFKDLQELTDILGDCQECLGKGDSKNAGEKLDDLAKRLGDGELTDQELRDLLRDQEEIGDAMRLLMRGLEGEGVEGDGLEGGGSPGTRRPIDPNDPDTKPKNEKQRADVNPKGQQRITGYARGGNFKKVPATAVEGTFRQAAQDAPEALDRQRIPEDAADIAKGYFNKLGNQK